MHFLADESCDFAIVRALRDAGHDVLAVREVMRGAKDPAVIDLAVRERRILLTEDKDFGQLVFASGSPSSGVVLLRYPPIARTVIIQDMVKLAEQKGQQLSLSFTVVKPGRIRLSTGKLFIFRKGEIWIAALKGKEEAALAGSGSFLGGRVNGKSVAVFTDDDLAERYISELGETADATPVKFPSYRDFLTFLKAIRALGFTHIQLDSPGKQVFEGPVVPIEEVLEEHNEQSP